MSICHGPGCRREAVVEFFCSQSCQAAWNAHWGCPLPPEPTGSPAPYATLVITAETVRIDPDGTVHVRISRPPDVREFAAGRIHLARDRLAEHDETCPDCHVSLDAHCDVCGQCVCSCVDPPVADVLGRMFGKEQP